MMRERSDADTIVTVRKLEGTTSFARDTAHNVHAALAEEIEADDYRVFVALTREGFRLEVWHSPQHFRAVLRTFQMILDDGAPIMSIDVHNLLEDY